MRDEKIVCVRHRDGWCATRKKTTRYQESIKTVCNHYVVCPWQIEYMSETVYPDCPECIKRLGLEER
jgi:hypothetical protein